MKRTDKTEPMIMYLLDDPVRSAQYLKESMDIMSARIADNLSSKQRHKKILGRQTYCWNGFVRHWVWEGDTWRVYVSTRGASFEVLASLTPDQAWDAWQDYYSKMK